MTGPSSSLRAQIYVSKKGNAFMIELALLLRDGLRDAGVATDIRQDGVPERRAGTLNFVVAPHEYFPLLGPDHHEAVLRAARHCVLVLTEQPDSIWFRLSLAYVPFAQAVFDINAAGVAKLAELGVEARLLRLGYHRSWDAWQGGATERPIDVVFMGSPTLRRHRQLAALGSRLQRLECRILLHDHLRPQVAAAANFVFGARKYELMARSRLLLNIHREDDPYFEWHRALGALANGCVLLTETATGYEPLDPFRHFVMAEPDALADHVTALCADDTVVARLRQDSYEFARTELDFVSWLGRQLPMFEEWTDGAPTSLPASVVDRLNQEFHLAVDSWASGAVPAPVGVEDAAATGTRRMLKRQVLSQLALRRRVESLECRLEHGTDQRVSTTISPAYRRLEPDVSVVIPLYNYEETVAEAIGSVFRSREVVPEVVVVEDHSHDRSREVVERFVLDHPELPLKLVALDVNVGLPSARNLGFEEARSEKVFLLDADNAVYPRALRKLSDAVDSSGAAFSYSMIECFGDGRRLLSVFPWDVERLRRQPYIDAMSMVRKDVWKAVGGFRSDVETLYGWEDYVFWLSLAEAGHEGRLVPEILCRYRLHGRSMINVTNLDIVEVWDELRAMFGLGPLEPLKWTT